MEELKTEIGLTDVDPEQAQISETARRLKAKAEFQEGLAAIERAKNKYIAVSEKNESEARGSDFDISAWL